MRLKYQDKLVHYFNKSIDKLPHVICLVGEIGCGKHTLTEDISDDFNLELEDITDNVTLDKVTEIILSVVQKFYRINCDIISEKEQNTLLKLLEEPVNNAYVFLITSRKENLLTTVLNRAIVLNFEPYTKEQLKYFTSKEENLEFVTTPGQALQMTNISSSEVIGLANKILDNITNASLANCLVLPDKLAYKSDDTGIPVEIFNTMFLKVSSSRINSLWDIETWRIINEYVRECYIPHVNKKILFENCLTKLKDNSFSKC